MEKVDGPQTPFEVFCHRCRVTFPVGSRRCIHCGGRLDRQSVQPSVLMPPGPADEMEDGSSRRGILSPVTAVWLILAMAGAMYRACTS